jgi:peptidoglycan DL-endopeptidase RipA
VAQEDLQPGDLLFWAYNTSDPATIHHVAIYLGRDTAGVDWMIDAPHTGATIQAAASTGPGTSVPAAP